MRPVYNVFLLCLASLCLAFALNFYANANEEPGVVKLSIGQFGKAPKVDFVDAKGKTRTLDTSGHKLTAVHFWATWCVPCVDELPQVDDAQDIFGRKFQVVPLSLDGSHMDKVKKFFADHKITHLPAYIDQTAKLPKKLGLKGLPGTIFLDEQGNIIARADGPLDWQREDVEAFLKERLK